MASLQSSPASLLPALACLWACVQAPLPAAVAASPEASAGDEAVVDAGPRAAEEGSRRRVRDPYQAYEEGLFDQALEGFVDRRVKRPEEPALALNVGSAHYKMGAWEEAEKAFSAAAASSEAELRQLALYDLGNAAYRQGRLEDAVELYKRALELDSEDQDAKFNLEFVREEIRRREEEAERRQQQQSQGEEGDQGEQQPPPQGGDQEPEPSDSRDGDGDGIPDEVERSGENPTDPTNPDTDGDGLADGAEDANRDGGLDPGETDPNRIDSDGDGVPDGGPGQRPAEPEAAPAEPAEVASLTPEEAERYLQGLEEGRPTRRLPVSGRPARAEKDW